jgi:amidohydrolase
MATHKQSYKALFILFFASASFAVEKPTNNDAAAKILPRVIEWRRHIHQFPELSNREVKTAKYVADFLKTLPGMEVRTGIAKTGVVGILKGALPGRVIGLRADMDALPVTEQNKLTFASKERASYNGQEVGVMHACGHDSHVAMLMGTASVLSGVKDKIKGTVVFIFQPAEEGAPNGEEGGAALMIKEGVMENPKIDEIFGIHIISDIPIGTIQYKAGAAMASRAETN